MKNCLLLVVFAVLLNFGVSAYADDEPMFKCLESSLEVKSKICDVRDEYCTLFLLGRSSVYVEMAHNAQEVLKKDPTNKQAVRALLYFQEQAQVCFKEIDELKSQNGH